MLKRWRKSSWLNVALAQLDRASGYGPEGQGFESLMLRQFDKTLLNSRVFVFSHNVSNVCFAHRNFVAPCPSVSLHAIDLW